MSESISHATANTLAAKKRVAYLDVLKFFGILFIYAGHYTTNAGMLYKFVFEFHVPLFFFVSGCSETFNKERNAAKNIWKKFLAIMLPFYLFALASVAVKVLVTGSTVKTVLGYLVTIARGCIRNTFIASSLWFLPCLFVIGVLAELAKKLRHRWLMILFSLAIYILNSSGAVRFPQEYNINFAAHYQLFFMTGYVLFGEIDRLLMGGSKAARVTKYVTGGLSFAYIVFLFFEHNVFRLLAEVPVVKWFVPYFTAMAAIWAFLLISYLLKDVKLLASMGKETLYYCGSEFMVKRTANRIVSIFIPVKINGSISALACSITLLLAEHFLVVRLEAKVLTFLKNKINSLLVPKQKLKNQSN